MSATRASSPCCTSVRSRLSSPTTSAPGTTTAGTLDVGELRDLLDELHAHVRTPRRPHAPPGRRSTRRTPPGRRSTASTSSAYRANTSCDAGRLSSVRGPGSASMSLRSRPRPSREPSPSAYAAPSGDAATNASKAATAASVALLACAVSVTGSTSASSMPMSRIVARFRSSCRAATSARGAIATSAGDTPDGASPTVAVRSASPSPPSRATRATPAATRVTRTTTAAACSGRRGPAGPPRRRKRGGQEEVRRQAVGVAGGHVLGAHRERAAEPVLDGVEHGCGRVAHGVISSRSLARARWIRVRAVAGRHPITWAISSTGRSS